MRQNKTMSDKIHRLFNRETINVDTYYNNGSMWLIFTDEKKWVIELTKEGTLWYNYYFFEKCFKFFSLDVVENQHYITEWVENTIQNGVKSTSQSEPRETPSVETVIQNGVKSTSDSLNSRTFYVENTIQNGVKNTQAGNGFIDFEVEDTIQYGVKSTCYTKMVLPSRVKNTIQNGVKRTELGGKDRKINEIEDTIQNGIKKTEYVTHNLDVEKCLKNGIKVTKGLGPSEVTEKEINKVIKETYDDAYHNSGRVDGIIRNGIKNTVNHPARPQEVVDKIINNGIKETESIASHRTWKSEEVIQNGIKETKKGGFNQHYDMFGTIQNGIKETNPHFLEIINPMNFEPVIQEMKRMNEVNMVLENGIREVKELPDKSGELMGYGEYYARQKDRTYPHNDIVSDVIRDGIKETNWRKVDNFPEYEDRVIKNGDLIKKG